MNINNSLYKATLPAEWVNQEAIILTWPHAETDWKPYLKDINKTYILMANIITQHEKLIIVMPKANIVKEELKKELDSSQISNIIFFECPTNDTWTRDHGFITLLEKDGKRKLLDFKFNGWGGKFPYEKDNAINKHLFKSGIIQGEYLNYNDFVLEGGSIETDGKGTLFTTSYCLLAPNRNEPLKKEEIEKTLLLRLGLERVLWIDYGKLQGDDTDGHIDTLVRTAPNDVLLYVGCNDKTDSHYKELKLMEDQLSSFKNKDGKPYKLLPLPMVSPIYDKGERLPATYANFVILNEVILYPTYAQKDNDEKAKEIISSAFPNRRIIGIDSLTLIKQHGSLHCSTMQIPKL